MLSERNRRGCHVEGVLNSQSLGKAHSSRCMMFHTANSSPFNALALVSCIAIHIARRRINAILTGL